jgi:hypothetical protein
LRLVRVLGFEETGNGKVILDLVFDYTYLVELFGEDYLWVIRNFDNYRRQILDILVFIFISLGKLGFWVF